MVSPEEMKTHISEVLKGEDLDNLSAKKVREAVESRMGLEVGDLKSEKATISKLIDECLQEQAPEEGQEDDEDDEEEDEPPKKKGKKAPAADGGGSVEKDFTCTTRSGEEAPKNVKKIQEKLMSSSKFMTDGPTLEIDVCGNKLTGKPRSFKSDNKGWYLTGKVEIPVGNKMVWAQVGMNVTIPGSNCWK